MPTSNLLRSFCNRFRHYHWKPPTSASQVRTQTPKETLKQIKATRGQKDREALLQIKTRVLDYIDHWVGDIKQFDVDVQVIISQVGNYDHSTYFQKSIEGGLVKGITLCFYLDDASKVKSQVGIMYQEINLEEGEKDLKVVTFQLFVNKEKDVVMSEMIVIVNTHSVEYLDILGRQCRMMEKKVGVSPEIRVEENLLNIK